MRVLIAEDDATSRRLLEATLQRWGYDVLVKDNGAAAWATLEGPDAPSLAILDWMMPGLDGVDVCRRVRAVGGSTAPYLILLTAKGSREDVVAGLDAGADDYVTKPFDREELKARLQAGVRIVELQRALAERVRALEEALAQIKELRGLLPICAYCKKIRSDRDYWQEVEGYITEHSAAQFSHSICPDCYDRVVRPELDQLRRGSGKSS
jgi:phosphoserine phosphatase RsbU/P